MQDISERATLSRTTAELPSGSNVSTQPFQEGWNLVLSGDVHWLDKEIRDCGWHFIWVAEPSVRSGVGKTAQLAIAGALKLALRRVWPRFNAASIEHIEITQFPWFFLAKVRVYPYQIQQEATLPMSDPVLASPIDVSDHLPADIAGHKEVVTT
jgi:hypothetical protein